MPEENVYFVTGLEISLMSRIKIYGIVTSLFSKNKISDFCTYIHLHTENTKIILFQPSLLFPNQCYNK